MKVASFCPFHLGMNNFYNDFRERFHDWVGDLHFSSNQRRALIGLFLIVCLFSIGVVTRGHPAQVIETAPVIVAPPLLVIDVAGGVKTPGVYSLPADSRVMDAIKSAGGVKKGMDMSEINLARLLRDGEQIYVDQLVAINPSIRTPTVRNVKKKNGPVNINRASAQELDALPGIGPVLAERIIKFRKVNGPFSLPEDLKKVSGIGSSKFAQFKSKIKL